ncbi:MAG: saccharopine dehydrogenase NADP-binding domain-containing protein [Bacteroidales bacterium]|jgi:saccharopine dehydrogenase-like NADP-dependent oxidoreductase|nr:saccharopine dehydrogenase NADP-binding domain-containing protein [Bacteroidales bacterium]MDX9906353.1 saccharopine dehydrogenase C-terminal domain-containing protein [Bacteroidales bacterium]
MKKVLILGAGMVVNPIVRYLLDKNFIVTVATRTKSKADEMIGGHPNGRSVAWTVEQEAELDQMIAEHDLTVSLLPYLYHVMVAKKCIRLKKNMVTTSYVKPEMKALDAEAKAAGIIILNELGLDPGIDHMSAMRIIDHIHGKGGKVEEFYSFCGALVAPEVEENPFHYKFTWAPKGVVMAGNNDGNFLKDGVVKYIPTENLFRNPLKVDFPNVGILDVYPNRDSLPYVELYGIPEAKTIMRGTFRYEGWCEIIDALKVLKLITYEKFNMEGLSYAGMMAKMIGETSTENIIAKVAAKLGVKINARAIVAMEWLGLFSNAPMNRKEDSTFEVVSDLMLAKMMIQPEERDMVVMQHTFLASYPDGKQEVIKSRMLDFGTLKTDTSVARTVALPAACGVEMILEGKIDVKGVYIPVIPEIYNPILDQLETMNIKMVEEYGLPLSERIS